MDREVVEQKLESLRHYLRRLETKCPMDAVTLVADFDLQDIVLVNFTCAVQISVDIAAHLIAGMESHRPTQWGKLSVCWRREAC